MRRIECLVSLPEFLAVGLVCLLKRVFDRTLFAGKLDLPDFLQNLLPHVLCVGRRVLDEVGRLLGWLLLTLYLLQELLKLGFTSGKLLLGLSRLRCVIPHAVARRELRPLAVTSGALVP